MHVKYTHIKKTSKLQKSLFTLQVFSLVAISFNLVIFFALSYEGTESEGDESKFTGIVLTLTLYILNGFLISVIFGESKIRRLPWRHTVSLLVCLFVCFKKCYCATSKCPNAAINRSVTVFIPFQGASSDYEIH